MNRDQAEHILDAYLSICRMVDADGMHPDTDSERAKDALREVILDAMSYRDKPNTVLPSITLPSTGYPPKVTYMSMDPAPDANMGTVVE